MPIARPPRPVPVFSQSHIDLAELCAWALWLGIDFERAVRMRISDAQFLKLFSSAFYSKASNPQSTYLIDESDIRALIRAARLYPMFRARNPIDFANGLLSLQQSAKTYSDFVAGKLPITANQLAEDLTLRTGKDFVAHIAIQFANTPYRIPLATRILSYSVPDLPIFNLSTGIKNALRLRGDAQSFVPTFYSLLNAGLKTNSQTLSKLQLPPPPDGLQIGIWGGSVASEWWKRRVLDLALLLHFNVTTAHQRALDAARIWKARFTQNPELDALIEDLN
jgi:hypothetical protein